METHPAVRPFRIDDVPEEELVDLLQDGITGDA
jgi:hypothetical protein